MSSTIEIRNLSVEFDTRSGPLRAADGVDLAIAPGEMLGLVGESGSGKSVTAMSILRLLPQPVANIVSGEIHFGGRDLLTADLDALREIRGAEISVIFQEPMTALSPLHRIGKQLVETQILHRDISREDAWRNGIDWLGRVGIADPEQRMQAYPYELSGGMRQRAMIAMALMLEPRLVIADEPTTALDVTIQAQIFDLLLEMKRNDTAILLITHDMGVVWETCDRVAVMYASQIVETGPRHDVFQHPKHPYTSALLQSIPQLHGPRGTLASIEGQVPSPLAYPTGCRFRERCTFATDVCSGTTAMAGDATHSARCIRQDEIDLGGVR